MKKLFVLSIVLLAVLVFVGYRVYVNSTQSPDYILKGGALGTLYVSMAETAPDGYEDVVSAYYYKVGEQDAEFEPLLDFVSIPTLQTKVKTRSGDMFFVYAPKNLELPEEPLAPPVEIDSENGTETDIQEDAEEVDAYEELGVSFIEGATNIALTNYFTGGLSHVLPDANTLYGERSLAWSEASGLLAFAALDFIEETETETATTTSDADLWAVYVVDPSTKEVTKIADGLDPQWSPDGTSLVYFGYDGLYQYTLATEEIYLVHGPAGEDDDFNEDVKIEANMNMALSSDGSLLAVSSPNQHALFFYDVLSWSPFKIQVSGDVPHMTDADFQYYWPTFSPAGDMLAVQMTDRDYDGVEVNPRIEIFNLQTLESIDTVTLEGFDFNYAFIDDWSY